MSFKLPDGKLPESGTSIFSIMSAMVAEHNAINLAQGFPDFDCDPILKGYVTHYMERGYNQYAPMPGVPQLREILAQKINNLYSNPVSPDTEITITAGATQAIFTAICAFVSHGDEVILIEPAYDCYAPAVKINGGKVVSFELRPPDYHFDWDRIEELINDKTRMIVINNPHNPSGTVLEKGESDRLFNIIKDHNIIVLSDEVYEHLVFDGLEHRSVLAHPGLYERSIVTFSFGKTFHNTGWKTGYAVASPQITEEFRKVHQFNVFSVNTPMQYALADYLQDPSNYLTLGAFYQKKRDVFAELMSKTPLKAINSNGSYFQLYDYSSISNLPDVEFAKKITAEAGVAVIPVSVFYSKKTDHKVVRFCFAKKESTLIEAGRRISEYFGDD